MDEKRIKEAESNIKSYREDILLWEYSSFRAEILETYRRNFEESLNVAQSIFEQDISSLWVVVSSYYAMYYCANAV